MNVRAVALAAVGALGALVVLVGCGDDAAPQAVKQTFEGPLHLAASKASHPRAGAAGDVVTCTTWGDGGSSGDGQYNGGATADSPEKALDVATSEGGFGGVQNNLAVGKEEHDRVLYVVEVGGVIKQAVIVHRGPASKGAGGPGWYVESWAHCDYSELPRAFTDSVGLQIWTARDGTVAPSTEIESWIGPKHCEWQSMTFLRRGKAVYVRDPQAGLSEYFAETYERHAELPTDAVDTGFRRDGDRLWLSADGQRAFVGGKTDVEVWPRTMQHLGCA